MGYIKYSRDTNLFECSAKGCDFKMSAPEFDSCNGFLVCEIHELNHTIKNKSMYAEDSDF